ncbi:MAG: YceI family protein [Pseudomonadota bacterium]
MKPLSQFFIAGAALAATTSPVWADAPKWAPDYDKSALAFEGLYKNPYGGTTIVNGAFNAFTAEIAFDPDNLAASAITVAVDMTSLSTNFEETDKDLPKKTWFNTAAFAKATFVSEEIAETGAGAYVANGILTVKGAAQPVALPFTLKIDGESAAATGEITLNRTDFGVGEGKAYETDKEVGFEVKVTFTVEATKAP